MVNFYSKLQGEITINQIDFLNGNLRLKLKEDYSVTKSSKFQLQESYLKILINTPEFTAMDSASMDSRLLRISRLHLYGIKL